METGVQEGDEALDQLDLRPGIVGCEGVGAQEHHGTGHILGERRSDARRMSVDGLGLIRRHVCNVDTLVLEQPDPGIERVHERRVVMHPGSVDIGASSGDALAGVGMERRFREASIPVRARHAHYLADG
jgi:hypothetical protein